MLVVSLLRVTGRITRRERILSRFVYDILAVDVAHELLRLTLPWWWYLI
jgi:hypothetical protein